VEEAAAAFRNLQCDSNTQISRGSVPSLPIKEQMHETTPAEVSMTMSALKTLERLSDARSNAEKVKFTTFKNAGTGKDESPVEGLLWTWEREFDAANLEPQVSRVLGLMTPGGNLSSWADSFRSISRDPKDPEDIRNWTWQRFRDELYASTMYSPPDKKKLLEAFTSAKCQEPGTPEQITAYTHAFTLAFQDLRRHHLDKQYSGAAQAQMFYNNLPKLVKHHMALFDSKRKDSELREDLSALRQEVREVMAWPIYKDVILQATNGRAMGAMGVILPGDSDKRAKRIEPQQGEIAKFTTAATTQSTAWLDQNAAKFKCRHGVVGVRAGRPSHVIVGPADRISAIFANKDARAAGLTEKVRKPRTDVNDSGAVSGRDSAKPTVSHVTAQAVQANMTSPCDQLISENNNQAQEDQKPESTTSPAKTYTYNSSTMPTSNVFHGGGERATLSEAERLI
jgi:hypothetical protein